MYFNVVSFKNSKTIAFTSEVPYSLDKLSTDWSIVTDAKTGQVISFKNSEVTAILSNKVEPKKSVKRTKKPNIKTEIVSE